MTSIKKNPHYNLYNKVVKLEGPHKSMLIGKWNKSVNYLLRTLEPTMTPRGLLNFYPHCDNVLFTKLFPTAAGPNPPANQRQVPAPEEAPPLPANATLDDRKLRELQNKPFIDYTKAIQIAWHEIMASFDDSIYSALETMAGANDILDIDLVQINAYINGPVFAYKSEENINFYAKILSSPIDLKLTLQENFEKVEQAWSILVREAPDRAPTQNALFAIMRTKLETNPRLKESITMFIKQANVTELNATYENFKNFVLNDYQKCSHDPSTLHLAFVGDKDYNPESIQTQTQYPYGLAMVKPDDEGLAFAANALPLPSAAKANLPFWKPGEYEEYLELKRKNSRSFIDKQYIMPPPPPGAPAGIKFGKLCFNCGWNKDHNSKRCPIMVDNPKFSSKLKKLVRFDPKKDTPTIDGIPINLSCAPGVYGTY